MTDAELVVLVRGVVAQVDKGGEGTARACATVIREALAGRGLKAGCHVGKDAMAPNETVEWYAGQFLDIVDNGAWFAMNSWINCADKFLGPAERS